GGLPGRRPRHPPAVLPALRRTRTHHGHRRARPCRRRTDRRHGPRRRTPAGHRRGRPPPGLGRPPGPARRRPARRPAAAPRAALRARHRLPARRPRPGRALAHRPGRRRGRRRPGDRRRLPAGHRRGRPRRPRGGRHHRGHRRRPRRQGRGRPVTGFFDIPSDLQHSWAGLIGLHVREALLPVAAGLLLALPLAQLCVRFRRLYPPVLGFTTVLYAIPSLAFFVVLIDYTGQTELTVMIPLAVYSLVVLVPAIVDGVRSVPEETLA